MADAVQMKGFGAAWWLAMQVWIADSSSWTERKTPLRMRFSVMSLKNRSTMFNQEERVGVKWMWTRLCLANHAWTSGVLWVASLSPETFPGGPVIAAQGLTDITEGHSGGPSEDDLGPQHASGRQGPAARHSLKPIQWLLSQFNSPRPCHFPSYPLGESKEKFVPCIFGGLH